MPTTSAAAAAALILLCVLQIQAAHVPKSTQHRFTSNIVDLLRSTATSAAIALPLIAPTASQAAVAIPPPKKAIRPYAWSVEFTNPPCLVPRSKMGEENTIKRFCQADVVFLGEHPRMTNDKDLIVKLLTRMLKSAPSNQLVLGLEMIEQQYQPLLDAYSKSTLPNEEADEELLTKCEWGTRWKFDAAPYKELLHLAKKSGIPLVALGVSTETLNRVLDDGFDGLTADDRAKYIGNSDDFVGFVRSPGFERYTDRVVLPAYEFYAANKLLGGSPSPEKFFSSRILKHEAIATRTAAYVAEHPGSTMLAVVANENVKFGYGVQERVKRGLTRLRNIVVAEDAKIVPPSKSLVASIGSGKDVLSVLLNPTARDSTSETTQLALTLGYGLFLPESRPLADYLWFSEYPELKLLTRPKNAINAEGEKPPGESSILGAF